MTATDIGLPTSPIVDTGRNLTPEWLHAIGRIEKLHSLKEQQKALGALDLTALVNAVADAEASLTSLVNTVRPNIVAFTDVPAANVPDIGGAGVSHNLSTDDYIALLRLSDETTAFVGGAILTGGAMPIKNADKWSTTQAASAASYITVTAFV